MGAIRERMTELGIELPAAWTAPPGMELSFDIAVLSRGIATLSGHGPVDGTEILMQGKVGGDLSPEQGYQAARLSALSILATLEVRLGDLDRVTGWVRAVVYVNAVPELGGPALTMVGNGFSDLVRELWGEAGGHARVSPGVSALPFDIPTIVEATAEID